MMNPNEIEFMNKFDAFVNDTLRNVWIEVNGFKMYTRKSIRFFETQQIPCFDIASIEAEVAGTGMFTRILEALLEKYPTKHFFVESILNPRLLEFLERYGFVEYREGDMILVRRHGVNIIK